MRKKRAACGILQHARQYWYTNIARVKHCSHHIYISNIIENPIMHLANGYISIIHAVRARPFFLFRGIYMLVTASLVRQGIDQSVHDFGSWPERVLRAGHRRIDCSFRVTQLSTVRPFDALSSRLDLREFQCASISRWVYRLIGKSCVQAVLDAAHFVLITNFLTRLFGWKFSRNLPLLVIL